MNGKIALTKKGLAYHRSKLQEATFTFDKYIDPASLSNGEFAEVDDAEEERDIFDEYEVREAHDEVLLEKMKVKIISWKILTTVQFWKQEWDLQNHFSLVTVVFTPHKLSERYYFPSDFVRARWMLGEEVMRVW